MEKNEIYKIYGTDYTAMTKQLLTASHLAEMIPPSVCVGIKPNLVSPTPAEYGATTHPQVVAGIIEYLQEHGITNILIAEGSWIGDKTSDAYEYCGYRSLCEKYGVEFVDSQKDGSHEVDCAGLKLKICNVADRIDFMINVPVVKGHGQTKITCALKNMKGLIPNTEKRHFHTMGLHQPIAHLSQGIHQDFIVADHICGDLELEDGGNPIVTNCVMTARDPVLLDSYVCRLLGYETKEVPYIGLAEELGSGSSDLSQCRVTVFEDPLPATESKNADGPIPAAESKNADGPIPAAESKNADGPVPAAELKKADGPASAGNDGMAGDAAAGLKIAACFSALDYDSFEQPRKPSDFLLDISYAIEDADSCSACYASLAPAILRLKEEGLWDEIAARLPGKIAIGQGFAGKTGSIGVGKCCRKFDIHVPGCPPEEEDVYRMLRSLGGRGDGYCTKS